MSNRWGMYPSMSLERSTILDAQDLRHQIGDDMARGEKQKKNGGRTKTLAGVVSATIMKGLSDSGMILKKKKGGW